MTSDSPPTDGPSLPTCPVCGRPVASVTIVGPTDGVASPCGCRITPLEAAALRSE